MATERACAAKPSASASAIAAGASARRLVRVELQDRGALHEVEHREARGEARRARGRQHVVRAGDIVADHLRRMPPEEDRAGIADSCGERLRVGDGELEMLRRDAVDQMLAPARDPRRRMIAPKSRQLARGDLAARKRRELPLDRRLDRVAPAPLSSVMRIACAAVSCSAWARRSAAIQAGSLSRVGDDEHLRRAGDHVDADLAENMPLGGGDEGVARADDLGHRRDRRGAIGERRDRLRAADPVDLVDAGKLRGARALAD